MSADSCKCDALFAGQECSVQLKFSTGSTEHYFPTTLGKYTIIDGPDLPAGETYVWKFEILATGYWPGQLGFIYGVAGYPLVDSGFHDLGMRNDEWGYRGRDGSKAAEGTVTTAFGSAIQNVGDQIMLEMNTATGTLNIYTKRVGQTEFTLEGGMTAFTGVFPEGGRVLRPAVSGICWQPCGVKFIE